MLLESITLFNCTWSIFFSNLSTNSFCTIFSIYKIWTSVSVYFPIDLLIIFLISPKFNWIFSVKESFGPFTDGSDSGESILLDKSPRTSDAYILFLYKINA